MTEVRINSSEMQQVLRGKDGPVAKILIERAIRVEDRAVANLTTGPTRALDTGRLRSSITHEIVSGPSGLIGRVGTNVQYALYVHEGTGIYGPKRQRIFPKQKRALAFNWKNAPVPANSKSGKHVYRSVAGMRPRPFLRSALSQVMGGSQITDVFR